jgi:hypothetical protein
MTHALLPLWADAVRPTFEWGRIQSNADWILPVAVCLAILLFVRWLYRRDADELRPLWRWTLTALRTAAFLGLLILYLQPHWRLEREEVRNSRVLLLADTSLSMGLTDGNNSRELTAPGAARGTTAGPAPATRAQQLAAALKESDFLARLRKTHDVSVFEFSEDLKRDGVVTLDKLPPEDVAQPPPAVQERPAQPPPAVQERPAQPPPAVQERPAQPRAAVPQTGFEPGSDPAPDWAKLLAPTGSETRLGQALRQLIQDERGTPVSGIIVFSDGGQNAGISPEAAVELAQEAKIPVFTVGLGSDRRPTSVAVSDLALPARAYPGDRYTVTGYIQAQGMAGKAVTVQVLSRPADNGHRTPHAPREEPGRSQGPSDNPSVTRSVTNTIFGDLLDSRQVTLGGDGEVLPVKFDFVPDAPGRRTLTVRVLPLPGDSNPADNTREADIEIVDRKNHVLLLADGPMRDYQFLRNQLFRDRYTTLDVLLQSGKPGMSQEAKKTLDQFPATREEMYDYDCVVAFDPNWQALNARQLELLEKWIGEQGGGLIVVAGPVNACRGAGGWVQDPAMRTVRNLYPVEFPGRLATTENNMYSSREPWPLAFTREGLEADFLWLGDTATVSRQAWGALPGVYSFCPVRGPKAGATVYARFSDPRSAQGDQQPVYFAGQFYGSGSVFYMGSGEMWRLRGIAEALFEQFYTKLIRHVSQGRLLRGSSRGVLLVGQDRYMLGNSVEVRAQLSNARLEPLEAPTVNLQVIQPDGTSRTMALRADRSRAGAYAGQFPALQEGTYRLELSVPESQNERLSRRIQVKAPDLERENPRRNDAVLNAIAAGTGGKYYVGMSSVIAGDGKAPLADQLKDRTTTAILPIAPNPQQEENWLRWSMIALCSLLCLEWLIRRLMKLA